MEQDMSMNHEGDIDGYCARISYAGRREPTLAVLRAIVAGHTAAIPFENLDVLAQRPIRLDLPALREKLVHHQRGGYCFEHNLLLLDVLLALGFHAGGLAARVHRGRPPGVIPPRSHMLLRVDLQEGPYLVDVGFGTALTAPLALEAGRKQKTPHETFRLVPVGNEFDLQVRFGETWTDLYRLSLQEQFPVDYEAANWFTSTYPGSLFVRNLIASRPGPRRRHTLYNDKFTIRHSDGSVERRKLQGAEELGDVLIHYFGIESTERADLEVAAAIAEERAAQPDFFDHG
jgi:N-hydroxyarylamine O-acetyltransferase